METLRRINLNALHTLAIVARCGSLTRAAEQQLLTPSAVSQRVSRIESQLRFRIFDRGPNGLSLTADGARFMGRVEGALSVIEDAAADPTAMKERVLRIAVAPTFARRWLFPRLDKFRRQFPKFELHFFENEAKLSDNQQIGISIKYVNSEHNIKNSVNLMDGDLIPVCSPALFHNIKEISPISELHPSLLDKQTLLLSRSCTQYWRLWLEKFDAVDVMDRVPTMIFNDCMLSFDAAEAGLGLAMASRFYIQDSLRRGKLVTPFPSAAVSVGRWCVSTPQIGPMRSAYEHFLEWILEEAALTQEEIEVSY